MISKDAANLADPNPTEATHVESYLLQNYPPAAVAWVKNATWIGPVNIPLERVDFEDQDSWTASKQPSVVRKFAKKIRKGTGHTNPVIAVQQDGNYKINIVDGHHRTLAYRLLNRPVKAYVGFVPRNDDRWEETHSSQYFSGSDPANKNRKAVMTKRGREYAEEMADWMIARAPGITKAAGTRIALVDQFSGLGETVAMLAKAVDRNEKTARHLRAREKQLDSLIESLKVTSACAQDINEQALARAEPYAGSRLPAFVPDEWEIRNKANGMIARQLSRINGNGHAETDPS